jgi:hypothetical protein
MSQLDYAVRADFEVVKVERDMIWIKDLVRGNTSITNDAERVCRRIWHDYPARRIIYCDSDGNWDELKHEGGKFTGFAAARDMAP